MTSKTARSGASPSQRCSSKEREAAPWHPGGTHPLQGDSPPSLTEFRWPQRAPLIQPWKSVAVCHVRNGRHNSTVRPKSRRGPCKRIGRPGGEWTFFEKFINTTPGPTRSARNNQLPPCAYCVPDWTIEDLEIRLFHFCSVHFTFLHIGFRHRCPSFDTGIAALHLLSARLHTSASLFRFVI